MNYKTPQSLLSLPPESQSPDAYRVLGLDSFESDRSVIKSAADAAVSKLRESKSTADEAAWTTAVQWVKTAYAILSDAGKKAAYDRKLMAESAKLQAFDPLAGMLPGNPGPASSPSLNQPSRQPSEVNRPLAPSIDHALGSPPASSVGLVQPAASSITISSPPALPTAGNMPEIAMPFVKPVPSRKRRRGIPWMMVFLCLFCVLMMGGLGAVLYTLQNSDKQIVLNLGTGAAVFGVDSDGDGKAVVMPGEISERSKRPFDPVMGGLAGDMPPPQPTEVVDGSPVPEFDAEASMPPMDSMEVESMAGPQANMVPLVESVPAMSDLPMGAPSSTPIPADAMPTEPPVPAMASEPVEPTEAQVAEAEQALNAVVASIKQHDWNQMKTLAEKANALPMPGPMQARAEALYQLVDLAAYYRGGLEKSLLTLKAGNEFDLTNDLKVVIVEVGTNKLIIRFNGKNKEYTLDSMPLRLAQKIAELSVPADSPTAQAAKFAFQAIAPVTTPPYRDEAIAELEKIAEEVEGAEPAKLVAAIRDIYPQ